MTARMLALVSDCYGMGGGIARYNQDLFEGLADGGAQILVLPRHGDTSGLTLPEGVRQEPAVFGRLRFSLKSLWLAWRQGPFDVVFCGHVYMAPTAWAVARLFGARYWLQTHGADIWKTRNDLLRRAIEAADMVTTVSRGTRHSLLGWVDLPPDRVRVLPDTVQDKFMPGPAPTGLRERLALGPGPILLTVGRLSAGERYKGHEQVFGALPPLRVKFPTLIHVVAGSGDDDPPSPGRHRCFVEVQARVLMVVNNIDRGQGLYARYIEVRLRRVQARAGLEPMNVLVIDVADAPLIVGSERIHLGGIGFADKAGGVNAIVKHDHDALAGCLGMGGH